MKTNFLHHLNVEMAKTRSQIKAFETKATTVGIDGLTAEELIRFGQLKQDITKIQYAIRAYQAWANKKEE